MEAYSYILPLGNDPALPEKLPLGLIAVLAKPLAVPAAAAFRGLLKRPTFARGNKRVMLRLTVKAHFSTRAVDGR